ncbi:hypothetical protein D3C77_413100 [compost metagenome]
MCPPSAFALSRGRNAWMPWITPHRLTSSIHFQSFRVRSEIAAIGPMPALLHKMSTLPCRLIALSARACTLALLVTSVRMPIAPISRAVACRRSSSMSAMITCAPWAIIRSAIPRPIPEAPPVMTATLPCIVSIRLIACSLRSLRILIVGGGKQRHGMRLTRVLLTQTIAPISAVGGAD